MHGLQCDESSARHADTGCSVTHSAHFLQHALLSAFLPSRRRPHQQPGVHRAPAGTCLHREPLPSGPRARTAGGAPCRRPMTSPVMSPAPSCVPPTCAAPSQRPRRGCSLRQLWCKRHSSMSKLQMGTPKGFQRQQQSMRRHRSRHVVALLKLSLKPPQAPCPNAAMSSSLQWQTQ